MRTFPVFASACLSAASALVALPARADYVQSANQPPPQAPPAPQAAETQVPRAATNHPEGWSASGGLGTGFAGTYAFGLEARAGYTWDVGAYLGGNVQYYFGNSVNNTSAYAVFVGPEVGYRWFPWDQLEIRPYGLVGLGFDRQVSGPPVSTSTHNTIAIQPGALWLWHFNRNFYAGLDTHFFVYPSPVSISLIAMAGAQF